MKQKQVFISTTTFAQYCDEPLRLLREEGYAYETNLTGRKMREDEIGEVLSAGPYIGLIAGTEPLTAGVLSRARGLKVISRVGVGMDNIDRDAARAAGICLCNTPGILTDAVAELTVGLMISCLRMIPLMDRVLRQGGWKKEMGWLLKGRTVGIIGMGSIGCRVAELIGGFGAKTVFYDVKGVAVPGAEPVSLETLLAGSDIITIHASGKGQVLGREEIAAVKEGAVVINTSRGEAIDEDALYEALQSGRLSGAGIDVYPGEPYQGKLRQCRRCVMTPHAGSYAREARIAMEIKAVENLIHCLKSEKSSDEQG